MYGADHIQELLLLASFIEIMAAEGSLKLRYLLDCPFVADRCSANWNEVAFIRVSFLFEF